MRIALALSGLPRLFTISVASWGRIIGKYQPDVFVHTWCDDPSGADYIRDQLGWIFKPTLVQIDPTPVVDVSLYPDRHWPQIDVDRSQIMWQGIQAAYAMSKTHSTYDLIIRGRMDWHVHSLDMVNFDGIVIPYDGDKVPLRFTFRGIEMHGFNDHFAYGPPKYMDLYTKTLDLMHELYSVDRVDYCPENFLAAALVKQNVPVMLQRMEHCLIRN
jgi:hypothetical protein